MKNELREHVKTKRKIRQAKRISAVDQTRGKRMFRAWLFLAIVVVFVIAECVGLFLAKRESDRQKSVDIQNQMVADLAIISTAFQSGNQPLFDKNFANYQTHLNAYSNNDYVKYFQSDRVEQLQNYATTLKDNMETIKQLNQLHAMLNQLGLIAETDDLVDNITSYRQNLIKLDENIKSITVEELKEVKKELEKTTAELESQLDSVAICVNVCPANTIKDKYELFNSTIKDSNAKFSTLNDQLAKKYSPDELILLLQ
jgi:hypothetical protein